MMAWPITALRSVLAARLFISTTTVKTHVNNLYRKLGTSSRTRAVARVRDLDLI